MPSKRFGSCVVCESSTSNAIANEVEKKISGVAEHEPDDLNIPVDDSGPKNDEIPSASPLMGEIAFTLLPLADWAAHYTREAALNTGNYKLGRGDEPVTVTYFSRMAYQLDSNLKNQAGDPPPPPSEEQYFSSDEDATNPSDYFYGNGYPHRHSIPSQTVQNVQVQPHIATNVGNTLALQVISQQHQQQLTSIVMQQEPVVLLAIRQDQVQQIAQTRMVPLAVQRQVHQLELHTVPMQPMRMVQVQVQQPVQRQVRIKDQNNFSETILILKEIYRSLRWWSSRIARQERITTLLVSHSRSVRHRLSTQLPRISLDMLDMFKADTRRLDTLKAMPLRLPSSRASRMRRPATRILGCKQKDRPATRTFRCKQKTLAVLCRASEPRASARLATAHCPMAWVSRSPLCRS